MQIRLKAAVFTPKHLAGSVGVILLLGALLAPADAARPRCGGKRATIVGTARADEIVGTSGTDVIVARGGADTIRSRGGSDLICAGDGRDRVWAGGGRDQVNGGAGRDQVNGGAGRDRVNGGPGIDTCRLSEVLTSCEADLNVDVQGPVDDQGEPATVTNNETANWTFDYLNNGPSPAPGTTLTISFAPRLTVMAMDPRCVEDPDDSVICRLGKVNAQGSGEVVISAATPSVCDHPLTDTFEVSAAIEASTRDHVPDNDSDSQTTAYQDSGC